MKDGADKTTRPGSLYPPPPPPRKLVPEPPPWISPGYVLITVGLAILGTAAALYYKGVDIPDLWWIVLAGTFMVGFGIVDVKEGGR